MMVMIMMTEMKTMIVDDDDWSDEGDYEGL